MRIDRQDLSDWTAVFGNNDAVRLKVVQNGQTPGLKLRRGNGLFFEHNSIVDSDQSSDQFFIPSAISGLKMLPATWMQNLLLSACDQKSLMLYPGFDNFTD